MSKYKALLGLAKEVLPSGERVLVHEGDDLLRGLQGLDERMIENIVSEMDARSRARDIKKGLIEKVAPSPEVRVPERMKIRKKFRTDDMSAEDMRNNASRIVGATYFPEEYASHLNSDEIGQLSSQYNDSFKDFLNARQQRSDIRSKLGQLNPEQADLIYDTINTPSLFSYDGDQYYDVAKERFKKIRDAMKGEK